MFCLVGCWQQDKWIANAAFQTLRQLAEWKPGPLVNRLTDPGNRENSKVRFGGRGVGKFKDRVIHYEKQIDWRRILRIL